MNPPPANPFYYLDNFRRVLDWIAERYDDLLDDAERAFLRDFPTLSGAAQALLVRMAMRKGELFRASRLRYAEIGCPRQAAAELAARGWVDDAPLLTLDELFALLTRPEISASLRPPRRLDGLRKPELLEALRPDHAGARPYAAWAADSDDCVYRLGVVPLCERLRLMFFGNLRQDWSEFVLADLGLFRYENVPLSRASRAFQSRGDIDDYLALQRCRERFEQGEAPEPVHRDLPPQPYANDWLESRRAKLLFRIAQQYERLEQLDAALAVYRECSFPGSRARAIRVLERAGRAAEALALAQTAERQPETEAEAQQVQRMLPRLRRALGLPKSPPRRLAEAERLDLLLPHADVHAPVEARVLEHLTHAAAPVFYVENALVNSLFGLLCWRAIFAPLPGAFFHPFHGAPADLHSPDFHRRREAQFAACLAELDSGAYRDTVRAAFRDKAGIQSPFVAWGLLTADLLELALDCIPPAHLGRCFERILGDVAVNRSGLPDLIQFWPEERRYRLIEVKGPGDRLQDNQIRWLDYCVRHGIPAAVCYVRWADGPA